MNFFLQVLEEHIETIEELKRQAPSIEKAGRLLCSTLNARKKILLCGNGGSAADAQHIAAEFMVRFRRERCALPAISLTTDTSILTAHANDYDFQTVFARQVQGLGQQGDCLVAISTSGNSPNIISAVETALTAGLKTIALTGGDGGQLAQIADIAVIVPSRVTARIQEAHILIAHWWCELADETSYLVQ